MAVPTPHPPTLFQVTLTAKAERHDDVEAMRVAFCDGGPHLASPLTISADDEYVTILFPTVDDDPATLRGRADLGDERTPAAALVKALLTFTSVRAAAGLAPPRELRVDVVPAPVLRPNSLSESHSDESPDDFPQFRPRRRRRTDVALSGPPR